MNIFLKLFLTFFKIGAFTFGGGFAMLPLIKEEILNNQWLSLGEIIDFIAVSESTPGPFAINISTFIGNEMGGIFGAFCTTLGVVMPSFIIILIVAKCYEKFKNSFVVQGCMTGLKPAVIGFIAAALLSIAGTVFIPNGFSIAIFKDINSYVSLALFVGCSVLAFKKVHPIFIICFSAVVGIAVGYLM